MCLVAFQKIFWKIFSGVWKRRRKTQIRKHKPQPRRKKKSSIPEMFPVRRPRRDRDHSAIAILPSIAISDWSWSSRSRTGSSPLARARALSLSLSLSFRKWIEVKMRGEIHFRVKGEICGQPEIIFRKIMLSVTAKRMHFPEIDFRNWFSADSNAAFVLSWTHW